MVRIEYTTSAVGGARVFVVSRLGATPLDTRVPRGCLVGVAGTRRLEYGSREYHYVHEVGRLLVEAGVAAVVSGGQRGVDSTVSEAVVGAGWRAVVVVPWVVNLDGSLFGGLRSIVNMARSGRGSVTLLALHLRENDAGDPRRALVERTRLVAAMSHVLVVPAARCDSRGTILAVREALRMGKPAIVVDLPEWSRDLGCGYRRIVEAGARPVPLVPAAYFAETVTELCRRASNNQIQSTEDDT